MTEEQVFLAALELANPADRIAYLNKVCGGDVEFRSQVEDLLAAHFRSGPFLDEPLGQQLAAGAATPINENTLSLRGKPEGDAVADAKNQEPDLHFLQPSARANALGRIGHYDVLQILGKGGFGIVFRAFDDMLQRVVALKVLAPAIAATSPARKRFSREARSSAKVRHENVIQVYAVEEHPVPYLVMEFIPGESLQQRLDRVGPLETPEIVQIGRQIAEGLAAAHATGLIHRDIKPGNVLLESGHQRVKISDFGLARAADDASLSQSGVLAGTPMYMAPEQARGDSLDHRADLFSLGSVLYIMASGRPPFRASTTYAVLKRVVDDTPRPIREVIPEVPQWLCDIIARLHAKKPEERFQSAREVADVLADCESQLKANARLKDFSRIPRSKPAAGRSGRWKWVAATALLLPLLALALTEIAGITHLFRDRDATPIARVDPPKKDDPPPRVVAPPKQKDDAIPSVSDADRKRIAALPAAEQIEEVRKELKRRNPNFDGQLNPMIEDGVVTGLEFSADQVSDISPVRVLTKLRSLECSGSDVDRGQLGARGLLPLKGLPLTNLICRYSPITDLSPLKEMELTTLDLRHTNVSDADVKNLAGLKKLHWLSLWGTRVTNVGLKELAGLKKLQWLSLENTGVTDVGLKELAGLQNLTHLSLYAVPTVTDAGVEPLAGLKALQWLDLRGTSVTDAGARKLAALLPSLKIERLGAAIEPMVKDNPPPPALAAFTDADVQRIAALPAAEQVEEVRKELQRRNPDFEGPVRRKIENDTPAAEFLKSVEKK